jgi:hypothetical protein
MRRLFLWIAVSASAIAASSGEEFPVRPYADPAQLDVPWPKHSHYKQPWRGFLETKSGYDFLQGIGVNYNVPGNNDPLAVRLLAEAGFKSFRIEIGFGSVHWDQTKLVNQDRMEKLLALCRRHGIRPTLLLNAHQGVPCPAKFFKKKLAADAPRGSRSITLADTRDLVVGRSGLNGLSGYWAAESLVTAIDASTGRCQLSKSLPKDLKAGDVAMATLAYLPLYPVGTPEFDDTAAGWTRYALLVCQLARRAGIDAFDLEIWNEMGFGTRFLDINNYYDKDRPKTPRGPDSLNPGGRCWELARRTIDAVKRQYPQARCIWGFSNTTFFHCKIAKLPPETDGQSYHPYGASTRSLPRQEQYPDKPRFNLEGFTPTIDIRMPEGWAHTWLQTECLMRLLNPAARLQDHPQGTTRFFHYITEHGVVPGECGIEDEAGGWQLKSLCLTRSLCLWLNKGVDVMHYFCAYDRKPLGMGLLPPNLPKLAPQSRFDEVATVPLRALRNLTQALAESVPIAQPRALSIDVVALGPQKDIFPGDATHPPLRHRDVVAVLPFQITPARFALVVYVMSYDATKPIAAEPYRLTIGGLRSPRLAAVLYDPHAGSRTPLQSVTRGAESIELEVRLVDHPRMLLLDERP